MPVDIHGWVEITRHDEPERSGEHAWQAVLSLGALIDVTDSISERLFGLSKPWLAGTSRVPALAANRGLPTNPSEEVCREIEKIRDLETRFGKGEFGGYTFATWREIEAAGLSDAELNSSDWRLVFDLIRRLANDDRLSPDKIRLVTYSCW
jgi:hypothetical protein